MLTCVWELDGKSSPHPFKKIRNIPWGHVYAMQLAHRFKKKRKEKKHPWGIFLVPPNWHSSHASILMCCFRDKLTEIGASHACMECFF
jgi:hypothetical protein